MNAEFFLKTLMGYRAAKVLLVSNRLGLFSTLARGPRSIDELAQTLECSKPHLESLASTLVGLGVLELEGSSYRNSALASQHLVPGQPGYFGHILAFHDMLWEGWSQLEKVVRTGEPSVELTALLDDPTFRDEYIRGVHAFSQQMAGEVARLLTSLSPHRLLDVGGGAGTYSLALLDLLPDAQAVILDLPSTLEVTRQIIDTSPHSGRILLKAGDYLVDEYDRAADLVLLSHVTHDEGPTGVAQMLRLAHRALRHGGHVAIHDWLLDDDHAGPLSSALFSVNVMVYTRAGRVYSRREYTDFLAAAGFGTPSISPVLPDSLPNPTTLLVARKLESP